MHSAVRTYIIICPLPLNQFTILVITTIIIIMSLYFNIRYKLLHYVKLVGELYCLVNVPEYSL